MLGHLEEPPMTMSLGEYIAPTTAFGAAAKATVFADGLLSFAALADCVLDTANALALAKFCHLQGENEEGTLAAFWQAAEAHLLHVAKEVERC
jgi:hypothetical protein